MTCLICQVELMVSLQFAVTMVMVLANDYALQLL